MPGTLRDSIYILEGLLEQQTSLNPTEIMTDTAGASDMVFGLFWLLGYQFAPRLADAGEASFWRLEMQGDRTNLIILLPGSKTGSPVANEAGLEPDTWARAPRWRVWQAAPPRRHGHPDGLRSAHLGSSPLVRGLGGGRREGAVRQDQ